MRRALPFFQMFSIAVLVVRCGEPAPRIDNAAVLNSHRTALKGFYLDDSKSEYLAKDRIEALREGKAGAEELHEQGQVEGAAVRYGELVAEARSIEALVRESVWTYASESENADHGTSLISFDGGMALVGRASTVGRANDGLLVLLSETGEEVSRNFYGGNDNDEIVSVRRTPDEGFILSGRTSSYKDFSGDVFLIKTDGNGVEEWSRTFGKSGTDAAIDAYALDDGGYLVFGQTFQGGEGMNVYIIRTDAEGEAVWEKNLGGEGDQFANSVTSLGDGTYLVAGVTGTLDLNDGRPLLIVVNEEGEEVRRHVLEAPGFVNPESVFAAATDNGYLVVAGFLSVDKQVRAWSGMDPSEDILLLSIDSEGNELWRQTFGGIYWDSPRGLVRNGDGGFAILAASKSYAAGDIDAVLIGVDETGQEQWMRSYGTEKNDSVVTLHKSAAGGLVLVGCLPSSEKEGRDSGLVIQTDGQGRAWFDGAPFGRLNPEPFVKVGGAVARASAPVQQGPKIGERPPNFEADEWINTDEAISLAGLKGKIIVLEFWATWCGPCRTSIPHLVEMQEKYRDEGVVIVSLTDEDRVGAKVDAFMTDMKMDYIVGTGSGALSDYGVSGIPTAFVIDREGVLRWRGHPMDDLDAQIQKVVGQPSGHNSVPLITTN